MKKPHTFNQFRKIGTIALAIAIGSFSYSCSEVTEEAPIDPSQQLEVTKVELIKPQSELIRLKGKLVENIEDYQLDEASRGKGAAKNRFDIQLVFQDLGGFFPAPTEAQRAAFDLAIDRWEKVIIKDVPSIEAVGGDIPSAFFGFPPVVLEGGVIDDLLIEVVLAPIDGPGGTLGAAGPNFIRNVDNLTTTGFMFFDVADLATLEAFELLDEVIVHEMGHVLGIGTLWDFNRELRKFNEDGFPYFDGRWGNQFWKNEGGTEFLPIQFIGGPGSALSHWDELVLDNELMTGFLNLGDNPLSRITAGSLRDMGYGTSAAAEKYDLPRGTAGVSARVHGEHGIDIANMEELRGPIGIIEVQ